jgi:hypothetical protein
MVVSGDSASARAGTANRGTGVEKDGLFHFDVRIDLPFVGQVIRYRGWLRPLACP